MEDFPEEFRMPFIQFMANLQLNNIEDALIILARIIDDSEKEINRIAELKYKKRHMSEMNKTISTRIAKATKWGHSEGYDKASKEFKITFPCSECSDPITIRPKSEIHQDVIDYLFKKGWRHTKCSR